MDVGIEILKILANIAVLFMSITIPTYAIAIAYLGKEHLRILSKIKADREEVERKLKKGGDIQYEELEREFEKRKARETKLRKKLRPLSVYYVVIIPSLFFTVALSCVVVGILNYPQSIVVSEFEIGYAQLGTVFIIFGLGILMYVLIRIERIAKRIAIKGYEGSE